MNSATTTTLTLIPFLPRTNASPPFSAVVTLDGTAYTMIVMWNFYRGDWYFLLTDEAGNIVVNQPLIGSPPNANMYLAPGLFAFSKILYRATTGNFEITS
jgi:hypothetical protein